MRKEPVAVTTRSAPLADVFHFVMTILTCGLWIPVWVACARGRRRTTYALTQQNTPGTSTLDAEFRAEHVPASTEYRARHGL